MSADSGKTTAEERIPNPNPQHVAWLEEGVESWNRRREEDPFDPVLTMIVVGEEVWTRLPFLVDSGLPLIGQKELSDVNLSGADLRLSFFGKVAFHRADFKGADLRHTVCIGPGFRGADFRGAKLSKFLGGNADFRKAKFGNVTIRERVMMSPTLLASDFTGAHFHFSDLTGADFSEAKLSSSDFRASDLSRANLVGADLLGARLDSVRLWRARLFKGLSPDSDPPFGKPFEFPEVRSLGDLIEMQRHLKEVYEDGIKRGQVALYFRGEPCSQSTLLPTVMRRGLKRFERDMLINLKTEFPAAFSGCEYAIDELAIARHFVLPSRLLDVTRNPLVGVYWASDQADGQHRGFGCEEIECSPDCSCVHPAESCNGKLHVFAVPTDLVCTYESDRVSIIANLARLTMLQQERLLTKNMEDVDFGYLDEDESAWQLPRNSMDESMTTLLHNIRQEKPYFADQIDIRDLFRVFVVEPRRSFDRVRAQSGAFLLSAFHERFEGDAVARNLTDTKLYDHHVVTIPAGMKGDIREDLDGFDINAPALYADVESGAKDVTRRFRERARMIRRRSETRSNP